MKPIEYITHPAILKLIRDDVSHKLVDTSHWYRMYFKQFGQSMAELIRKDWKMDARIASEAFYHKLAVYVKFNSFVENGITNDMPLRIKAQVYYADFDCLCVETITEELLVDIPIGIIDRFRMLLHEPRTTLSDNMDRHLYVEDRMPTHIIEKKGIRHYIDNMMYTLLSFDMNHSPEFLNFLHTIARTSYCITKNGVYGIPVYYSAEWKEFYCMDICGFTYNNPVESKSLFENAASIHGQISLITHTIG